MSLVCPVSVQPWYDKKDQWRRRCRKKLRVLTPDETRERWPAYSKPLTEPISRGERAMRKRDGER